MRLAVFIDSLRRAGAESSMVSMAPGLIARGVDLHYILQRPVLDLQPELQRLNVEVTVLPPGSRLNRLRSCRREIRRIKPGLVHTVLFESDITARPAARTAGIGIVSSWVSDSYSAHHFSDPRVNKIKLRAAMAADAATVRLADRIHAVSQPIADRVAERLQVAPKSITVIPRGRPRDLAFRSRREHPLITRIRATHDHVLLAVGRQEYVKGFDRLLLALAELTPDVNWGLAMVGGHGMESGNLRNMALKLGIADRVSWLGPRDDVLDLMLAADCLVVTSRVEGFPNIVVEGMACGLPLVVPDSDVLRGLVAPGVEASLVDASDSKAVAGAITATLGDPATATRQVQQARQRFLRDFTVESVVDRYHRLYEEVVDARSR